MAIIQISKIQHRSGNLVDLPQLDEAEFGWASDQKRLFIGKEVPNENIEVLTSYSNISFSQINGAVGNLDMSLPEGNTTALAAANGEVLAFDGVNWTNRGGNTGGLINLGHVSNLKISGGAIGYVLETDGTGNVSWTPKGTLSAAVQNVTNSSPAVVTTEDDNIFTNGVKVTFTQIPGMTQLNGEDAYVKTISSREFELYSGPDLVVPFNTSNVSLYSPFPYVSVIETASSTNIITVSDASQFSVNDPVKFVGTAFGNIDVGTQYYISDIISSTEVTISESVGGIEKILTTASGPAFNMYLNGGRVLGTVAGSGLSGAGGSNTSIQYNVGGLLGGSAGFTFDSATSVMTLVGNAAVGNLNASGVVTSTVLISNTATGTPPLVVSSTTRVPNLNVAHANVSDFSAVATQSTGVFYPTFVSGSSTGNYSLSSNSGLSFNAATGVLTANGFSGNIVAPGSNTNVLFNDNNSVNGSNGFVFDKTSNSITVGGNIQAGTGTGGQITGANLISANYYTGTILTASQPNITSLGTLTSLTVSGSLTSNNITTGSSATAGSITGNWTLTAGSKLQATYADLAEYYQADKMYEPGTVLEIGGQFEVTLAEDGSTRVAGVVTTDPAYVLNTNCPGNAVAIALQGRVPVKVRGHIRKGDMMISAGGGYARPSASPQMGTVIGKALQNYNGDDGVIEVAVGRL